MQHHHTTHNPNTHNPQPILADLLTFYRITAMDFLLILRQTCDASIVVHWSRQLGCLFVYISA